MCNKLHLQPCFSSPRRIIYTCCLQPGGHGCPNGSQLLKYLKICEQHNTFYNFRFVNKWGKNRKTYSWLDKSKISWDIAQVSKVVNYPHSKKLHYTQKNVETKNKAFHHYEAQSKWIFDVASLQLAPSMTIKLSVHTLQLFKLSQWIMNMKTLK